MSSKKAVKCTIMRGGTSKGLFFIESELPAREEGRDELLLELMGSPDVNQIDGLGGAVSVTSKVAIIAPSDRADADVEYTFAQVSVDKPIVSYKGNCGNISSAVGPFAIEKGLVKTEEGITKVRIHNTNTDKIIVAEVAVEDGCVKYTGDFAIAGVPGTASRIKLRFLDPAGSVTGKLLPTGKPVDVISVDGLGDIAVSIVDAANPLVFIKYADVGLTGTESTEQINEDHVLLARLEEIRGKAAVMLGFTRDYKDAAWSTPTIPKLAMVGPSCSYETASGSRIEAEDIDFRGYMMSMQKAHPSYAMTGAMCTAAAAVIKGTVVNEVISEKADLESIRIGHPNGVLPAGCVSHEENGAAVVDQTCGYRTANLLMDGYAYYNGRKK